ncbi:urease accessory protein [Wenyingzhuangia heitensis]|uniref:Urease accessory protein n=1 Tax=Wenyingzhuangia heitensis TaxID=1487859 RepID=A0ABX0UAV7_9FLAO|nr:urease accessory UreF family protein [Wenyingzhuangia heitensis]NIJ45960.1 urease accessory protein [Wenyingzhuangia heitensis]
MEAQQNYRLYQILHFADSAFPIGGFAYSNGMEYAVKSQLINTVDELNQYLKSYIDQMYAFDLAFVKQASSVRTIEELQELSDNYNAMLLNPALKKSGMVLGKNWLSIIKNLFEVPHLDWYKTIDVDFHIVFAATLGSLDFSVQEICELFVFMNVRDQLSVVVRLGTLGPTKSHQIQKELLSYVAKNYTISSIPQVDKACKNAYVLELCQLSHQYLYTKLFQN